MNPTEDSPSVAAACTPGTNVDRAFWFDVIHRFNTEPQLQNEYQISDFAFAMEALNLWRKYENTGACWNPLGTTWDTGAGTWTLHNNVGVKSYTEQWHGIRATAATISKLNGALPKLALVRRMLARQGFDENTIREALNTYSGNGAYVGNLVNEWRSLYNDWRLTTISSRHSGKCLDVSGGSRDNGGRVLQWSCHNANNQQWYLKKVDGDYYLIISANSGRCLDVPGWSRDNGAQIQQWDCHGGANQQWRIVRVGSYYKIISRHSGKCLDVPGGSRDNGARIIQWDCHDGANQQWSLNLP